MNKDLYLNHYAMTKLVAIPFAFSGEVCYALVRFHNRAHFRQIREDINAWGLTGIGGRSPLVPIPHGYLIVDMAVSSDSMSELMAAMLSAIDQYFYVGGDQRQLGVDAAFSAS